MVQIQCPTLMFPVGTLWQKHLKKGHAVFHSNYKENLNSQKIQMAFFKCPNGFLPVFRIRDILK
jgi:hypothetical protein